MHQAGVPVKRIARIMGRQNCSMRELISRSGGIRPRARVVDERHLSLAEREEISRGLAAGLSFRAIGQELGRVPSTICREVNANGGRHRYRALEAERMARHRAKRPKVAKLARCRRLRAKVEAKLKDDWSPEEISGWLAMTYPDNPEMYVSHETMTMPRILPMPWPDCATSTG
jgi:IS30 family transposase